jgi:hypothetical protein
MALRAFILAPDLAAERKLLPAFVAGLHISF